jgi:hypothetical protein
VTVWKAERAVGQVLSWLPTVALGTYLGFAVGMRVIGIWPW